jgi:hypothetical protein
MALHVRDVAVERGLEAARKELREHVSAITSGAEKQDDNPISLFLPDLKVTIR